MMSWVKPVWALASGLRPRAVEVAAECGIFALSLFATEIPMLCLLTPAPDHAETLSLYLTSDA